MKHWLIVAFLFLSSCAIKPEVTDYYTLSEYSDKKLANWPSPYSILVNQPEAMAGFATDQMFYSKQRFSIFPFAHHAWSAPPAHMLLPLLTQSLQSTGYFRAVASSITSEPTDYRIDTQLIEIKQNFQSKPSRLDFTAKISLMRLADNKAIASKVFKYHLPCPSETPYGGVFAANQTMRQFTADATYFVLKQVDKPRS